MMRGESIDVRIPVSFEMLLSYLKYLLDFFTSLSDDDDDLLCLISHNIIHFLPM